jgi:hypothetical protein
MARKRGKTFSTTVTQEVEVDVDLSFDEVVAHLKDEGYEVILAGSRGELTRDIAKQMIERLREEFGGTLAETDYWHGTEMKIPPGATVLILPGL